MNEILDAYFKAWNEPDEGKRKAFLDKCWSDSGTYTDPLADVTGREALSQVIAQFHTQMPGASIVAASGLDQHHDRLRFAWKLRMEDGSNRIEGIDVAQMAEDGRLRSIVGFWGEPPPA